MRLNWKVVSGKKEWEGKGGLGEAKGGHGQCEGGELASYPRGQGGNEPPPSGTGVAAPCALAAARP